MTPFCTASAHTTNSTAPAAPSMCPVHDFAELTLIPAARSPNTALMARVSLKSLAGVVELLEHDDPGPFAHDEPVAGRLEGARGGSRAVVPLGERLHVGKAADG